VAYSVAVRRHGLVPSAAGLGLHGHACWTYADDADLRAAAVEFLADGLHLGQRLLYVGANPVDRLREDLAGLPGSDALPASGRLEIVPLDALYDVAAGTDPEAMLATYAAATERALADGFAGLRVVAEVTALADDPRNWPGHTRWESVADRYMAARPLAALCCYDRRLLSEQIVRDLAAVHPAVHGPAADHSFRLFAGDGDALVLEGSVDYFSADVLRRVLPLAAPGECATVLDLGELTFADHHAALALAGHARHARMSVRNAPAELRRTCELMGLSL